MVKWNEACTLCGQDADRVSGHPLWQVRIMDADPDARKGQGEVTVKIISIAERQLPPEMNGLPFRPPVFEGLTVTPYAEKNNRRPRVAYSLRVTENEAGGQAAEERVTAEVQRPGLRAWGMRRSTTPLWGRSGRRFWPLLKRPGPACAD